MELRLMPRRAIRVPKAQFMTEGQFTRRQAQFISARHRHIKKHPYHAAPNAPTAFLFFMIQITGRF